MATLGRIQEFDPKEETIEAYLEWVQLFIQANGIKDEKRVHGGALERFGEQDIQGIEKCAGSTEAERKVIR